MKLSTLLQACGYASEDFTSALTAGLADMEVRAVTADSRKAGPGTMFVGLKGLQHDGSAFIPAAVLKGAAVVVEAGAPMLGEHCETDGQQRHGATHLRLPEPARFLARAAALLAGKQPRHVVAITGTNGKSSTADFLRQLWTLQGKAAASIGTLGLVTEADVPPLPALTTPDAVSLADALAALARAGVQHVALEASSHGLVQHRLDGVQVTEGGFSNLTRDHLDYHGTLDAYREAKLHLFEDLLPPGSRAVINADMDPQTLAALRQSAKKRQLDLREVGENGTTVRILSRRPLPQGQELHLELEGEKLPPIFLPLTGAFQADNALLAAALCWDTPSQAPAVLGLLSQLVGVPGRCERIASLPNSATAYVDYAHTPDALEHVLQSLRPHVTGKLIVVFGAGGDRDRGKRPLMGQVAAHLADVVIVTDDNPRTEDAASIRAEILKACPQALEIGNRHDALQKAVNDLQAGDVLLVAGKGHEKGQIIGTTIHPFDDRALVRQFMQARSTPGPDTQQQAQTKQDGNEVRS
ncbi:UDP-N-acetylmuramoyl-L-alanyl-D-glutamate--2,6-diaminopimelate ligase [Oecophyllibacter saccharovorans]|uniref:UDP-N-acetylmuramoyl-L-alanyl-D-glutamate--2, 6-diaminopimelate ligase n=1 Tax=Oecophyllibacter saccharovorans TaxID=2558360 RepID=UPI0011447BF6|nr:UDP-N-acetylmuramoyl-L-alanyl-D-glutamate--2,6-diaminopimelate ligase [Oecophyllibacter saccharovorans]QDH14663.1 UDP-N-acetylmuramoyl-L-alanyl-D-glutamate--2,6-diaminopimelate ligase [Oecophyllibacter saccharovorans]